MKISPCPKCHHLSDITHVEIFHCPNLLYKTQQTHFYLPETK